MILNQNQWYAQLRKNPVCVYKSVCAYKDKYGSQQQPTIIYAVLKKENLKKKINHETQRLTTVSKQAEPYTSISTNLAGLMLSKVLHVACIYQDLKMTVLSLTAYISRLKKMCNQKLIFLFHNQKTMRQFF